MSLTTNILLFKYWNIYEWNEFCQYDGLRVYALKKKKKNFETKPNKIDIWSFYCVITHYSIMFHTF